MLWGIQPWAARVINSGVYVYASRYEDMLKRYTAAAQQAESPCLTPWQV